MSVISAKAVLLYDGIKIPEAMVTPGIGLQHIYTGLYNNYLLTHFQQLNRLGQHQLPIDPLRGEEPYLIVLRVFLI